MNADDIYKVIEKAVGDTVPPVVHWRTGRKASAETRRKMSIASLGKKKSPEHCEKIRQAFKGKPLSLEHRKKLSLAKKGKPMSEKAKAARRHPLTLTARLKIGLTHRARREKCTFWKGGVTEINEALRSCVEYNLWRDLVFARDNWTCVLCNKRGGDLNADHIKPFAFYPENRFDIDNGRTLCVTCHRATETYGRKAHKFRVTV